MVSTVSSDFGNSHLSSSPKLQGPSNSSSNLRRYVVSTRGIPRPVDKKATEWLRPVSAPKSFRYEMLATPVSLYDRRMETRETRTSNALTASEGASSKQPSGSHVGSGIELSEKIEKLNNIRSIFYSSDVVADQTNTSHSPTSVILDESMVESLEKTVDSYKNDPTSKLPSHAQENNQSPGLIQWSDDERLATSRSRSMNMRDRHTTRVMSPSQRLPVYSGFQRPLQRGRLFYGRPVQTVVTSQTGKTLTLGPTSLGSRALVAWSPAKAVSDQGARHNRRAMSADRDAVNASLKPLPLTLFQAHRARTFTASVNVRPFVSPDVKEEDSLGLVVMGRSLNAVKSGIVDAAARSTSITTSTTTTMLALPPSLSYLLDVANQKVGYGGSGRVAPSGARTVEMDAGVNSKSVAFDHVTEMATASTIGRVDVRFDGVTKSPNGHHVSSRTPPRLPSAAAHRSNGVVSPPGSYVGRTWCVTGGPGNWSPPRSNAAITTHSTSPRSTMSPTLQVSPRPTTANGFHTAADLFSRSRLRRTGSSSSRSDRNSETDVDSNRQLRLVSNESNDVTEDISTIKSPVDSSALHVNDGTAADTPVFSFDDPNVSKLPDILSNGSEVSQDKPEVKDDSAAGEVSVTHHLVLTNGTPGGTEVEMNGCHSDAIDVEETVESAAEKKDGNYFLKVVEKEQIRLNAMCTDSETDVNRTGLPDDVAGKIRAAIGKAQLLTTKKFKQFRDLCHKNLNQDSNEPFPTTCQDLEGFWDLVMIQVEDVNGLFAEISLLKQNNWKESKLEPDVALPTSPSWRSTNISADVLTVKQSAAKSKVVSKKESTPATSKSDAAKSRDEARKRLLAAKAAGRQRKASEESDEVKIFVS